MPLGLRAQAPAEEARSLALALSFNQYIHATRRSPLGKTTSVVARWNKLFSGVRGENPSIWSKTFNALSARRRR